VIRKYLHRKFILSVMDIVHSACVGETKLWKARPARTVNNLLEDHSLIPRIHALCVFVCMIRNSALWKEERMAGPWLISSTRRNGQSVRSCREIKYSIVDTERSCRNPS